MRPSGDRARSVIHDGQILRRRVDVAFRAESRDCGKACAVVAPQLLEKAPLRLRIDPCDTGDIRRCGQCDIAPVLPVTRVRRNADARSLREPEWDPQVPRIGLAGEWARAPSRPGRRPRRRAPGSRSLLGRPLKAQFPPAPRRRRQASAAVTHRIRRNRMWIAARRLL